MANFNEIIQEINTNLPDNNKQSITAKKLRDTFIYTLYETEEEYDISANNNGAKYEDLTAALGTDALNVPIDIRKGGMTIRFINSTSNKYEQWRYLISSITNGDFANTDNWQNVRKDVDDYDISANNNGAKYEDLTAALGTDALNVPIDIRKGGMTIRFINSTSNKYEQYRYLISSITNSDFANTDNWQNVGKDVDDIPTAGSENLVESGGVYSTTPSIGDNSSAVDLDFSDEDGNVLMRLSNGHVRVKNFNSADLKDLNKLLLNQKFKNKKFAIIGDSISTYAGWLPSDVQYYEGNAYATYYPRGDVDNVNKTWWYKMCTYMGIDPFKQLNNCSWSGSKVTGSSTSTSSAYAACSNKRISDLCIRGFEPDIIICWISCNDWATNVDLGNWQVTDAIPAEGTISQARAAYALMLNKIHTMYPKARIFCCTILDDTNRDHDTGWPSNNGNGVSTYQWNQNIIEIANAFGCDIIDLHNCGINYSNIGQYYAVDSGLHPNAAGQTLVAKKIIAELNAKY